MIVSIGTGCFFEEKKEFQEPAALGWDGIINQVKTRPLNGFTFSTTCHGTRLGNTVDP